MFRPFNLAPARIALSIAAATLIAAASPASAALAKSYYFFQSSMDETVLREIAETSIVTQLRRSGLSNFKYIRFREIILIRSENIVDCKDYLYCSTDVFFEGKLIGTGVIAGAVSLTDFPANDIRIYAPKHGGGWMAVRVRSEGAQILQVVVEPDWKR